jgi:uncharacterized protein YecE (DUF72 family)
MPPTMPTKASVKEPELRIGTSGWHYADWWGKFYPAGLARQDALAHYVTEFSAAELNAPF